MVKWDDDDTTRPPTPKSKPGLQSVVDGLQATAKKGTVPTLPESKDTSAMEWSETVVENRAVRFPPAPPGSQTERPARNDSKIAEEARRSADAAISALSRRAGVLGNGGRRRKNAADDDDDVIKGPKIVELVEGEGIGGWYPGSVPGFRRPGGGHAFLHAPTSALEDTIEFEELWLTPCIERFREQGFEVVRIRNKLEIARFPPAVPPKKSPP